jgi:carbamoylphosphate synthase large subunit
MGFRAIGVGIGGNEQIVREHADSSYDVDTRDRERVLEIAVSENAAGLVTCGSSTAICTVAFVNEQLGLSSTVVSYETALNAVAKHRFRELCRDLSPPGIAMLSDAGHCQTPKELTYPIIVKPSDSGGSKGISIVSKPSSTDFLEAWRLARDWSTNGVVVVEEYLGGSNVGIDALVIDGRMHTIAVKDKMISPAPSCVVLEVIFPSNLPEVVIARMKTLAEDAIERLGMRWGFVHIDMVISAGGMPKIVDFGPRMSGGGPAMTEMMRKAYGFNRCNAAIQLAIGEVPDLPRIENSNYFGGRFLMPLRPGTLRSVSYDKKAFEEYDIFSFDQLISAGTYVSDCIDSRARAVIFTSSGSTHRNVRNNLASFADNVKITMIE